MGFKTVLTASLVAGGIFTGAVVNFTGTDGLDTVKTKITEQANKLNIFKSNETKLINKVGELRTDIQNLQAQIDTLLASGGDKDAQILDLQKQLADKQTELETLEADLNADGDALANEIVRLQGELDQANAEVEALETFATTTQSAESDQTAVNAALAGETVVTTPPPTEGGGTEPDPDPIGETKVAGATDVNAATVTVPVAIIANGNVKEVTLNRIDDKLYLASPSELYTYTAKVNGQTFNLTGDYTYIGTLAEVDHKNLTITSNTGTTYNFYLLNQ